MYKLIVLFAMAVACMAAPRPGGLVAYSPAVVSPVVAHVPVAYSSQSSTVVHSAPLVHAVPDHYVASVPIQPVPVTYSAGVPLVW